MIRGRGPGVEGKIPEGVFPDGTVAEGRTAEVLISEALATSREICSWPARSCSIVAFNASICWPIEARSRAIDCICAASTGGAPASDATPGTDGGAGCPAA